MTIQFKLTMSAIAIILVANALLGFAAVEYFGRIWLGEVQTRVRLDLNSARAAYDNRIDSIASYLRALTFSRTIASGLKSGEHASVQAHLEKAYRTGGMDFLTLVAPDGRVVLRARNPGKTGDDLSANPLIARVLKTGADARGTVVLTREQLAAESPELARRAHFELVPTPAARPTEETSRSDGMVMAAAAPLFCDDGRLLAVIYAGDLLNNDFDLVDRIKDEVFLEPQYGGRDMGTVTIFQDDLRISTNVKRKDGTRAVGTRLSAEVYDEVVKRGGTWADEAFVVTDWYITAYEPIRDPNERIIGALYVGLLREPFARRRNLLTWGFVGIVCAATIASLVMMHFVSVLVLRPIRRITAMSRRIVEGDLSARVEIRPPGEMGRLCQAIDQMADAISEREAQLKATVNRQIGRSEQLASVGRLAAGVAHEINNPLTGVLTFAHMLRDKDNMDEQDRQDLDLIIHETTRAAEIVRGLLDFARERTPVKELLNINDVVRRTLKLLGNQKAFQQIVIVDDLEDRLPLIDGDGNQIQQVLLNLSLNACEAMSNGGTLLVSTRSGDGKVLVSVTDTGCGIKREHLDRIFEPFFSTKPVGKGTGLGLSVSYGIVQQHGGTLEVESEEGRGSTFTIVLPAAGEPTGDGKGGRKP